MQQGWGIDGVDQCLVDGDTRIPIELRNKPLIVQGQVRRIGDSKPMAMPQVRVLNVKLSDDNSHIQEKQTGWKKENDNLWRGVLLGHLYQDPAYVPGLDQEAEWQRATLILNNSGWEVVEFSENLSPLDDHKEAIEEIVGNKQVVTMLSRNLYTAEELGSRCWNLLLSM